MELINNIDYHFIPTFLYTSSHSDFILDVWTSEFVDSLI